MRASDVFNVKHLSLCFVNDAVNSSASSFQPREADGGGFKSESNANEAQQTNATLKVLD